MEYSLYVDIKTPTLGLGLECLDVPTDLHIILPRKTFTANTSMNFGT